MTIDDFFDILIKRNASDLHLISGYRPTIRIDGKLRSLTEFEIITPQSCQDLAFSILTSEQKDIFLANRELDLSHSYGQGNFRVNIYYQKGAISLAARYIPSLIRSIDELNLPHICHTFTQLRQGFILVTGPTGHGKSTTISSMINEINQTRDVHIISIEDPIEYIFPKGRGLVSQREMRLDTHSWEMALRSVLREDVDVVFVGEIRDYETISTALTIAETGHLVFTTLHTNSASQTIDRIVDIFPANQQAQIRLQLSANLEAVLSQRLLPMIGGGRIPAFEILLGSPAVKSIVRDGKTHLLDNIIQTSKDIGMETLEGALASLVKSGKVSLESAMEYSLRPDILQRFIQ